METKISERRQFLKLGLGATAGILTAGIGCKNANGEPATTTANCQTTPQQDIGPFYPNVKNGDGDVDLTTVQGKTGIAEGEIILVRGKVLDENCQPLEDVLVEIWQANKLGRYSHEGDTNNAKPLDPNFEGWGEMLTGPDGAYGFKTIKPGAYPIGAMENNPDNWRTPHIHFRVTRRGYHEVVTQMYFEGEKLNETDGILAELGSEERGQFILAPGRSEAGLLIFNFNLSLKKVQTLAERLDGLAGKYELKEAGKEPEKWQFRREGQQLYLDLPDYVSVELKPAGKDEFLARTIYGRFVFNRSADGSVLSVTSTNTSKNGGDSKPQVAVRV